MRSIALLLLAACGNPAVAPPPPKPPVAPVVAPTVEPPPEPPSPPGLRLANAAKPTKYTLDLKLDPATDKLTGKVVIGLDVTEPAGGIWLHGADITIESATVKTRGAAIAAKPIVATPAITEAELLGLQFDKLVPTGPAELEISYTGKIYTAETSGVHKVVEGGDPYLYTQFESTDARRAFPCFDEPSYKVPLALTIRTRPGNIAVANGALVRESEQAGDRVFEFAPTKPLPTYLIAFAVGPFEIVDGGKAGKNQTPLRVIVPKGRSADAGYAVKATPEILGHLEEYFGMPYPYDKLDQIAVPRKGGAMENAGLITYGINLILIAKDEETVGRKRRFASVAAHEIGHHWFGDLVTLAWWDDTWLNESFASWIEKKMMLQFQPSWNYDVSIVEGRSGAMRGDTLSTARKVRQPITSKHDIAAAFDGITYGKGSALLAMFEHWIGPDKFQTAIRKYIAAHQHGIATTKDFFAAVSAEAGIDVAPVMSSFLDQIGVPLVHVGLDCEPNQPPKLELFQQRYQVIGSKLEEQTWQIPVCVKFGDVKADGKLCTLLATESATVELPTKTCPKWVHANDSQLGYYRVQYRTRKGREQATATGKEIVLDLDVPLLERMLAAAPKQLTLAERVGLYGDLSALVSAGKLDIKAVLDRIAPLARESSRHLVDIAAGWAGYLDDDYVSKKLRPSRARFIRKQFGDRARALGFAAKPGEDDDQRLLRPMLLGMVAHTGEDPQLIATAKKLADKWLADKKAVDSDLVGLVLGIAARFGDKALFDKLHAAAKTEKDRKVRGQLLGAMADFHDPAIVKAAMAIALTDEFPAYESIGLVWGGFNEDTKEIAYQFVKDHHDELIARLPRDSNFIGIVGSFCDEAHAKDAKAFIEPKIQKITNGPRRLAQTLERNDQCIAKKKAYTPGVEAFLAKW